MRELGISPLDLDQIHPLRKLRWGLYLEQIEIRKKQLADEARDGYSTKDKDQIPVEHPEIDEFIRNKNLEVYGKTDVNRFSYIPKYIEKKKKKG